MSPIIATLLFAYAICFVFLLRHIVMYWVGLLRKPVTRRDGFRNQWVADRYHQKMRMK